MGIPSREPDAGMSLAWNAVARISPNGPPLAVVTILDSRFSISTSSRSVDETRTSNVVFLPSAIVVKEEIEITHPMADVHYGWGKNKDMGFQFSVPCAAMDSTGLGFTIQASRNPGPPPRLIPDILG